MKNTVTENYTLFISKDQSDEDCKVIIKIGDNEENIEIEEELCFNDEDDDEYDNENEYTLNKDDEHDSDNDYSDIFEYSDYGNSYDYD